jgi:hypothetical protein
MKVREQKTVHHNFLYSFLSVHILISHSTFSVHRKFFPFLLRTRLCCDVLTLEKLSILQVSIILRILEIKLI